MTEPGEGSIACLLAILAALLLAALVAVAIVYRRVRAAFAARLRDMDQLQGHVHDLLSQVSATASQRWMAALLERLARYVGAQQAWLIVGEGSRRVHVWSTEGDFQATDAEAMTQNATLRFPWRQNQILVARGRRTEIPLTSFGWYWAPAPVQTMLLRSHKPEEIALIGFVGEPTLRVWPETASAIASFLTAVQETLRRHRLEETKLELERRITLGRRMETVGAFASGMAHNLNNLINAIGGFAAIAELQVDPAGPVANNLADIQVAVRRARDLVRDVLHFGRRLEGPAATIRLDRLLAETSVLLAASLPANVTLRIEGVTQEQRVLGNFGQLQQVLLNLCDNAALAMPEGGVIECCCGQFTTDQPLRLSHKTLDPGSYVTISIRDQGGGISAAALPRLFEPFFTTRRTGTGLGLSTAREIIEEHGGAIDVRSAPGAGSSFILSLPLARAKHPAGVPATEYGGGKQVLIVNADSARLAMDEEMIAALGYEPHGLTDPSMLGNFDDEIDAVLIVGLERAAIMRALDRVRATGWRVPLLVAAARPDWVSDGTALHYPIRPGDLSRALSRALAPPRDDGTPAGEVRTARLAGTGRHDRGDVASDEAHGSAQRSAREARVDRVDGAPMAANGPGERR